MRQLPEGDPPLMHDSKIHSQHPLFGSSIPNDRGAKKVYFGAEARTNESVAA
jgi:hypothetical protein